MRDVIKQIEGDGWSFISQSGSQEKDSVEYVVIIEKDPASDWGAYVPDLPGCVAVGGTKAEVEQFIQEAIQIHVAGLREDGIEIPQPKSASLVVNVA